MSNVVFQPVASLICDSNHKKMLRMTRSLCHHHEEASEILHDAEQYFDELSKAAGPQDVQNWTRQIEQAEMMRLANPKVMDLYGARGADENAESTMASAPSRVRSASEIWLEFALMIEEKQYVHSGSQYLLLISNQNRHSTSCAPVQT